MVKKASALIMAMVMTFSLAACGGKTSSSTDAPSKAPDAAASTAPSVAPSVAPTKEAAAEDIVPEEGAKLLIWEGKDEFPFLEPALKKFTEQYNIPVELQEVGAGDQMAKVKTDGPAGLAADVLVMPHDHLGEALAAGIILPNDFYEEDTKANFNEMAVEAVSMNGVLYGYPRNIETYALYYNKSLVKPEDLSSWENIIKFSKGYTDAAANKFGFMWEVNNWYYNAAWILGSGGYVFGKDNTDPTDIGLNNAGSVEAMKFYHSLREALPIAAADASNDVKTNLFQTGKLPINLDGIWNLGNFSKEKLGFDVGVVPLPKMPNGSYPKSFAGVKAYYVSSFSKYPNAARLLSHYLTSEQSLSDDFKATGIVPARKGMEESPAIKDNEMVKGFMEQFQHIVPMPAIIEMRSVWTPMTSSLEPIWNGEDVTKILNQAVADIKTGIASQ